MKIKNSGIILLFAAASFILSACSSSKVEKEEKEEPEVKKEAQGALIINTARDEQKNTMYSRLKDSTYLYWLDNKLVLLRNQTKCNIYALNVLYASGFMTPDETLFRETCSTHQNIPIYCRLLEYQTRNPRSGATLSSGKAT